MPHLDPKQRKVALGVGGVLVLILLYRWYSNRSATTASTAATTDPNTADPTGQSAADYASLSGQEQSDVAGLQSQDTSLASALTGLTSQESSDVAGLGAQEQSDVAGLYASQQTDEGTIASQGGIISGLQGAVTALTGKVNTAQRTAAVASGQAKTARHDLTAEQHQTNSLARQLQAAGERARVAVAHPGQGHPETAKLRRQAATSTGHNASTHGGHQAKVTHQSAPRQTALPAAKHAPPAPTRPKASGKRR